MMPCDSNNNNFDFPNVLRKKYFYLSIFLNSNKKTFGVNIDKGEPVCFSPAAPAAPIFPFAHALQTDPGKLEWPRPRRTENF